MTDFCPFSLNTFKKLLQDHNKGFIVQRGPRLMSLDSIFSPQDFKISIKRINLEKRPGTVYSTRNRMSSQIKADVFLSKQSSPLIESKKLNPKSSNQSHNLSKSSNHSYLKEKLLHKMANKRINPPKQAVFLFQNDIY